MSPSELSSCCFCHVFRIISPSSSCSSYSWNEWNVRHFFFTTKTTQPRPQVFSVNGALTCRGLHFWRHFLVKHKILPNLVICFRLVVLRGKSASNDQKRYLDMGSNASSVWNFSLISQASQNVSQANSETLRFHWEGGMQAVCDRKFSFAKTLPSRRPELEETVSSILNAAQRLPY